MPEQPELKKIHPRDQAPAVAVRVALIEERNRRVARDKAWETSWVRRGAIAGITYCAAVAFLAFIAAPNFWLAALVPTGGYLFSTLTLPLVKKMWVQTWYNPEKY